MKSPANITVGLHPALRGRSTHPWRLGATAVGLQVLQMCQAERRAEVFPQIHPVLFRNGHKHVDDRWVKLTPGAALNLFTGMGHRQGSAVGTVADHGIERICNCKDARTERNLFALYSPGVTRAVKKLLECENDLC